MSRRALVKTASIISTGTVLSRILGLFRTIVEAAFFGRGPVWDAFLVAWMVPNFFRRLLEEGALTSSFIPVFTEYLEKKPRREAWYLLNVIGTLLTLLLFGVLALVILGIGIALRHSSLPEEVEFVLRLLRALFPYFFFISFVALGSGVLNSFQQFAVPALAPALLNVFWIFSILWICPRFGTTPAERIYGLAVGVLLGGAVQVLIFIFTVLRKGYVPRWKIDLTHPAVKTIGKLMLPAVFALAVTQVNLMVDRFLGLLLGKGAVSSLYYANRLVQFPLAIFGIALGTAVLPTLSVQFARDEMKKMKETLFFALRLVFFMCVPAAVGLAVLRYPIIRCIFERGKFTASDTERVAFTLLFYSVGLFAYAGSRVLVPVFYSLREAVKPVKVGILTAALNLILDLCLMWRLREGGLALATAIAGIFNFIFLFLLLRKRIGPLGGRKFVRFFLKIFAAAVMMGFACFFLAGLVNRAAFAGTLTGNLLGLFVPITGGIIVYALFAYFFNIEEVRILKGWISRRS